MMLMMLTKEASIIGSIGVGFFFEACLEHAARIAHGKMTYGARSRILAWTLIR